MLEHKLEKRDEKNYCVACQQTYKGKPRKLCPGVPIIDKKHPDYNNLNWKYWKIDSIERENLRPITKACCIKDKETKEYIYFYDKAGETEIIDPTLPPVLDDSCCDSHDEWYKSEHCLKSEKGLKKLNLVPGDTKPVAVCSYGEEFLSLYNPLDCEVYLKNLPIPSRRAINSWDKIDRSKTDLLDDKKLKEFNLKPRDNTIAPWAEWNPRQNKWELLWDIKQCEINDPLLPVVYQKIPDRLVRKDNLFKINKKISKNTEPKGCIWKYDKFIFLYDPKDCELIDPELPPIAKYHRHYSEPIANKFCPSYLKNSRGLEKLNLTPNKIEPVAVYHDGEFFRYLYNPLDCEVLIPNLPAIKQEFEDIPGDLIGDHELLKWNLKPRKNMKACCVHWLNSLEKWEYFWDIKQCEIDDISLPLVVKEKSSNLYEKEDLVLLNRRAVNTTVATACMFGNFTLLYNPEDCELINPELPPCYPQNGIPDGLKSEWGWQQSEPLFELKKDAVPVGCFIKIKSAAPNKVIVRKTIFLYNRSSLLIHDREVLLSQTKLKQHYHLSPKLLKLLGEPDKLEANLINEYYAPVRLYSRKRIEKFLADNSEIYTKHLARRNKYLAIFEQNKDKLLSPESRKKAQQTKKLKKKARKVLNQFNWDDKKRIVLDQSIQCLKCASGVAMNKGFFCAINPLGLDLQQMPCQDWQKR